MNTIRTSDSLALQETAPVVALSRRTIDAVLVGIGIVLTLTLVIAGALLMWGSSFSSDYVERELSSQNVTFPPAAALEEEGRDDLVAYGDEQVDTGDEAEAYASFINGHLEGIGGGLTYAELSGPERQARGAVEEARAAGEGEDVIAALEEEAGALTAQRDTLFKGETLRGLLLSAYAWSTVGKIAGYAAIGAFLGAAVMLFLVLLGIRHYRRVSGTDPAPAAPAEVSLPA